MILPVGKELEGQLIISDCCQECMISICVLVCININFNATPFVLKQLSVIFSTIFLDREGGMVRSSREEVSLH